MTTEQQLIILLSNPCLNKQENNTMQQLVQMKLDWNMISAQLMRHNIEAIAYYHFKSNQLCNAIPISLYKQIKGSYEKNKMMQTLYWNECIPIFQKLKSENLKFCILKGAVLQPLLYPSNTRSYNDIDIMIIRRDYSAVWKILNEHGFSNKQHLSQIESKREQLFLLLNTYEFPEFEKVITIDKTPINLYLDVQHRHTLAPKMGYLLHSADEVETSEIIEVMGFLVPRQNMKYLLIHLCTHAFGDATTISEIILNKAFRLRNFADIVCLVEKYIDIYQNHLFYNLVTQTNTIKPVYFCLYYCTQIYHVSTAFQNITEHLQEQLTDLTFLNQYGFENGPDGIYQWEYDLTDRIFSSDSINEVKEKAQDDIRKYADYDTRIN